MSAAMMGEAPFGDFNPSGMEAGLTSVGGAAGGAAGGDGDGGEERRGSEVKIDGIKVEDEEDDKVSSERSESGEEEKRLEEGKAIPPFTVISCNRASSIHTATRKLLSVTCSVSPTFDSMALLRCSCVLLLQHHAIKSFRSIAF